MGDRMKYKPKMIMTHSVGRYDPNIELLMQNNIEKILSEDWGYVGYTIVYKDITFTVDHEAKTLTFKPIVKPQDGLGSGYFTFDPPIELKKNELEEKRLNVKVCKLLRGLEKAFTHNYPVELVIENLIDLLENYNVDMGD